MAHRFRICCDVGEGARDRLDAPNEGLSEPAPCLPPVLGRPLAGWGPKYLGGGVIPAGVVRGLGRFPSREFPINAWLTVTVDLLAWTQHVLLYDQLDLASQSRTQNDPVQVPARRRPDRQSCPRRWLRIDQTWPWATALNTAFQRLERLPTPLPDPDSESLRTTWTTPEDRAGRTITPTHRGAEISWPNPRSGSDRNQPESAGVVFRHAGWCAWRLLGMNLPGSE
jgi:hypothetical protein